MNSCLPLTNFQEIYPPGLEKLSYITDNSCSKEAMWKMELEMMKVGLELVFLVECSRIACVVML